MRTRKVKLSALFLLSISLASVSAQYVIPASGGDATGSGGSASYTVGQIAYNTNITSNGSVTQGVQQPFEISVVTGIEQTKCINLTCLAYPNPTTNNLLLIVENYDKGDLIFQLSDINGKLLTIKKVIGNETSISMDNLIPATYFLKITSNNLEIKTFKIIKK